MMTDHDKVLKGLRCCINLGGLEPNDTREKCSSCPYVAEPTMCGGHLMRDAADTIEELSKNWKYCSDLLNIALKHGCKSMTALLKLYDMEERKDERL
jgi:hypothetical protein